MKKTDMTLPEKSCQGFTLVELIVTLAVLAIALAIAIPSYQGLTRNTRLVTVSNELIASLALARSEAVRRGKTVKVCKADANSASPVCSASADWAQGWLVDVGGTVIRTTQINNTGISISSAADEIEFRPNGSSSAAATIEVIRAGCTSGETNAKRVISVSGTGRASVTSEAC